MRTKSLVVWLTVIAGFGVAVAWRDGALRTPQFTADFGLAHCERLVPWGANRYFSIRPGTFLRLEGFDEEGGFVEVEQTVTGNTLAIEFELNGSPVTVMTRVVEEREWIDGELAEVSSNYYARCRDTNNIFYFGEDVDIYENGKVISHEGSWRAGVDGAQAGLMMPGTFLIGARYYQEIAPVSRDRAEHLEMGLEVETDAGLFVDCVMILDTSELEPDEQTLKIYAPNVGPIVDDFLQLVEYRN